MDVAFSVDGLASFAPFAFSPDGQWLAVESPGKVEIWDLESGVRVQSIPAESVQSLRFIPDGKMLAVGAHPEATLWNVETATKVQTFHDGIGTDVKALAFSPCGTTLATSSTDLRV